MPSSPEDYWLNPPSIIVDDTDPTIRYSGTWYIANETEVLDTTFEERVPYFNTLHVLQIFSGSFSYSFTGAGISVFATPVDNSNYTSQCFLDENELIFEPDATKAQFGQSRPVCQAYGLPDNIVHTISVNISVPPRQQQDTSGPLSGFAFDYFIIQPPSGVSPWHNGNQDVLLSVLDQEQIQTSTRPTLNFWVALNQGSDKIADVSRGWEFDPGKGFNTTTPGSQFNLTFIGTSVWWYGYEPKRPNSPMVVRPSAAMSIDGGTPSALTISGSVFVTGSQNFLFKTPLLQYGSHQLMVFFHGGDGEMPLTLQSLLIQKSTPTVSSSTVRLLPSATMFQSPTSTFSTPRGKTGGIVGGIAGGVVVLLLVASGVCLLIRRAKRRQRSMPTGATAAADPFPVPTEETAGVLAPRKAHPNQQNIANPFMQQELQAPPLTKWTRRHTISGVPTRISPSFADGVQPHGPSGSRLNLPVDQDASLLLSTHTDSIIEQPTAQMVHLVDASHPTTTTAILSASLPTAQTVRQEDSGLRMASVSDLPPFYTTH